MPAYQIDRADRRGFFTSHWTSDGKRTLCGLEIVMSQPYCENGACRRCERVLARKEGR